jgi:2-dehydropantoate 2-reductase
VAEARYVVVGAGAIGGTVGVRLHEAGREVVLVARGAHLDAIRERGLRLDEPDRSRTVRIPAVGRVSEVGWRPGDVAVLCTKSQDTEPILDELCAVAPDAAVACVQNGVANERLAAARFGRVQAVCVMLPAEHLEPGRVVSFASGSAGMLDVGRYPDGVDELTERIAGDLTAAGFVSEATASIMSWKYGKLLANLGNAVEATCGFDDPDLRALRDAARIEGERCLAAAGIEYLSPFGDRRQRSLRIVPVDGYSRRGGSTWQSMLRGTGSVEAEFLNGEIVALGRAHGVPTPVNSLLLAAVTEMARAGAKPGARTAAELLAKAGVDRG